MHFFKRREFGCHTPFRTVPPEPGMELRSRPWDPLMILSPLTRSIHIGDHARAVLIDERLLLPDDGVVYLNWRLARWLVIMPQAAHPLCGRQEIVGHKRLFDAYVMHVPTVCGFLMTVSLKSKCPAHATGGPGPLEAEGMYPLPTLAGPKP